MRVRIAVFPAAGLGTRFLPATKAQPKEMLPLVDKPMIQYVVEEAVAAGLDRDHASSPAAASGPSRTTSTRRSSWSSTSRSGGSGRSWPRSRRSPTWRRCRTSARRSRSAWATPSCAPGRWWGTSRSPSSSATTSSCRDPPCIGQLLDRLRAARRPGPGREAGAPGPALAVRRHQGDAGRRERLPGGRPGREAGARGGAVGPGDHRPLRPDARRVPDPRRDGARPPRGDPADRRASARCAPGGPSTRSSSPGTHFDTGEKLGFLKATVDMALARPDLGDAFREYLRGIKL